MFFKLLNIFYNIFQILLLQGYASLLFHSIFEYKMPELPQLPEKKPVLFAPKPPPVQGLVPVELQEKITGLAARLRISEERYTELRKKLLVIERNMIVHNKKLIAETKTLASETAELRHMIHEVEDRILTIIKELRLTARREDIDVMKKYIEIWDPTRFVTRESVEKLVKDILREKTEIPKE